MKVGKTLLVTVVILALGLALTGCSGPAASTDGGTNGATSGPGAGENTIVERGTAFVPSTLEVSVGDTVTFLNEDRELHIVRIDGVTLGNQNEGESVTWTAERPGEFPFNCPIHPSMTGTIVVK